MDKKLNTKYEIIASINIGKYLRIFKSYYNKIICVIEVVKKSILEIGVNENKIEVIYGSSVIAKTL